MPSVVDTLTGNRVTLSYAQNWTEEPQPTNLNVVFAIRGDVDSLYDFESSEADSLDVSPQRKQPRQPFVSHSKILPPLVPRGHSNEKTSLQVQTQVDGGTRTVVTVPISANMQEKKSFTSDRLLIQDTPVESPLSSAKSDAGFLVSTPSTARSAPTPHRPYTWFPHPRPVPTPRNTTVSLVVPRRFSAPPRLKAFWGEFVVFVVFIWAIARVGERLRVVVRRTADSRKGSDPSMGLSTMV